MSKEYSFPATSRLRKKKDFQKVYAHGRVFTDNDGVLYVFARPSPQEKTRIGIAAGKKLGGAVIRNQMKRRMRETYRLCQSTIKPGWDLLWIARRSLLGARFAVFLATFCRLAKRAGIYGVIK